MNILFLFLLLIILMVVIQLYFREPNMFESFSFENQKNFRENRIQYYKDELKPKNLSKVDIQCHKVAGGLRKDETSSGNTSYNHYIEETDICEGFDNNVKQTDAHNMTEHCKHINKISVEYDKINALTNKDKEIAGRPNKYYGCGYCYDNKEVLFGDENGPYTNIGAKTCGRWVKPGESGTGGVDTIKNLFVEYPFQHPDISSNKNMGTKYTAKKMYEQELCSKMKDCGDNRFSNENGEPLCGWCYMGRKGDGVGEGMVRKGGTDASQNETKYDDDYCPWPGEIKVTTNSDGTKKYEPTEKFKKDTADFDEWKNLDSSNNRLLNGLYYCGLLNQRFPCFNNYLGDKKNRYGESIGHSNKCYLDLWERVIGSATSYDCDYSSETDIKNRIVGDDRLPESQTFALWNKTNIPDVRQDILNIGKRMNESKQYNLTLPDHVETPLNKEQQRMFSALANYRVCNNGDEPDSKWKCQQRFISEDNGYARPKPCLESIIEEKTGVDAKTDIDGWDKFDPQDSMTYVHNWAMNNDYNFRQLALYGDKSKLEEKYESYNGILSDENVDKVKTAHKNKGAHMRLGGRGRDQWTFASLYEEYENFDNKNKIEQDIHEHPYDKLLLASYYIYGKPIENSTGINLKFWQDDKGGTNGLWVKLCWEDFRKYLKKEWAENDDEFITKEGNINLSDNKYNSLRNLIEYKGTSTEPRKKFRNLITTYKDSATNFDIPVQLNRMGGVFITKDIYEHKWFPFWRVLPYKYYIEAIYEILIVQTRNITRREERSSASISFADNIRNLFTSANK